MNMLIIENKNFKITINEVGALLKSFYDKNRNKECLWSGNKEVWPHQDVVIFPIIGPGTTNMLGIKREINQHGFCRYATYEAKQISKAEAEFSIKYNEETLKLYPYKFEFIVNYKVYGNSLLYKFTVLNHGKEKMPFMVGSHPGFLIDEGATLEIPNPEFYALDKGLVVNKVLPWPLGKKFMITKEMFKKYETIVLDNSKGNNTYVLHTGNPDNYVYTYKMNSPLVAVWSNANNGNYICIEPWWGETNYVEMPQDFEKRNLVQWCNKKRVFAYSISFKKAE
jgi:galactose mutarotase-like enzyme